ncbi:MAG: NUDIX domain-containing protein [Acidimicrobiia bacterium]|nr:NUDIX domain-containing protein [Acidimicrobiia bacterium]
MIDDGWRGRRAARTVLLDPDRRVLLINASDPGNRASPEWWEIPGGGQDPGETSEEAAARELYEETGIADAEVGPCVWVQHARFSFGGYRFDQKERIHVAWCGHVELIRPAHLEPLEALAFKGARWWAVDELLASDVPTLPINLREHLPALVEGDLPDTPLDIGLVIPY